MIKVDSLDQQRRLGVLHQRPRWARAYKWAPLTAVTRLLEIRIRVGRTGALNPWAIMEPVQVGGVTVTRATLHNEEDINRKGIRAGDDVIVQRAGDVIPQIVGPAGPHRRGTKEFRMPTHCPLCGTEIVKPEGEAMHRCPNRACPSRGLETLINWTRRRRHRRRRRADDPHPVGEGPRPLAARPLPPDEGGARRARGVRRRLRAARPSSRSQRSKQVPFSRVLLGLNIPGDRLGARAQPRQPLRHRRRVDGRDARGSRRGRGLRLGPRRGRGRLVRATTRTARSSRSCASSASGSSSATKSGRAKAR